MLSPRSRRVPVIVLSGGLGCGKTTLLNHLLAAGVGRVGVVINDFGEVNVDAFLVRGHVDATASFSGGCLCCLSDPSELDDTLARLGAPALDLDVILVEASGLAEPRELARMILSSEVRTVRFGGVVEILDAASWLPHHGEHHHDHDHDHSDERELPVARDHLAVASLIVVNKTDLFDAHPQARRQLTTDLACHCPDTPVVHTTFGRLDPHLLFDAADRPEEFGQLSFTDLLLEQAHEHAHHHDHDHDDDDEHSHHDHSGHAHDAYVSVSVESELPCSPRDLVAFLETRQAGVVRVKGRTWFDVPGGRFQCVVQAVGGYLTFEKHPWPEGQPRDTRLVAIGCDIDAAHTEHSLRACLADTPLPPDHLHAVSRYLR